MLHIHDGTLRLCGELFETPQASIIFTGVKRDREDFVDCSGVRLTVASGRIISVSGQFIVIFSKYEVALNS